MESPGRSFKRVAAVAAGMLLSLAAMALLLLATAPVAEAASPSVERIVVYKKGATAADRRGVIRQLGNNVRRVKTTGSMNVDLVRVKDAATLRALRRDARVRSVTRNAQVSTQARVTPNDPLVAHQWYLKTIDAFGAWGSMAPLWSSGAPVPVVGVVDEVMDQSHPDLAPNLWVNPREIPGNGIDDDGDGYIDNVHGVDIVGDSKVLSTNGHATHVAGVIGAAGNNSVGVAGLNWRAQIMAISALESETGKGSIFNAVMGGKYAIDHGAKIVNMSIGVEDSRETSPEEDHNRHDLFAMLVDYAEARKALIVAAAGNEGNAARNLPAALPSTNMISVASVGPKDKLSTFSNFGGFVEIAAPGEAIASTTPGNSYGLKEGTSMATPIISGAAAMYMTKYPTATPTETRAAILNTAMLRPTLRGKLVVPGVVNVSRMLAARPSTMKIRKVQKLKVRKFSRSGRRVTIQWSKPSLKGTKLRIGAYWIVDGNKILKKVEIPKKKSVPPTKTTVNLKNGKRSIRVLAATLDLRVIGKTSPRRLRVKAPPAPKETPAPGPVSPMPMPPIPGMPG